ncbi:MAG TPA: reverse transcriptase domain-containing protein, partial [Stenomitos sp.]
MRLLLSFCLQGDFDVIALQEITFHTCDVLESHFTLLSNMGPRKLGTAILIRKGVSYKRELLEPDGRLISIDVGSVTVINVYAPSGSANKEERNEFFRKTVPAYAATSKLPIVMMADFNCVDDTNHRSQPNIPTRASKRTNRAFTEMLTCFELVDIWVKMRPGDQGHTFFHPHGSSRIDRVYSSSDLVDKFTNIQLETIPWTDHMCLLFTFTNMSIPASRTNARGLWKLNTSVLQEEAYCKQISYFIENSITHPLRESNVSEWWEKVFKPGVKKESIRYCTERARLARNTKRFYQQCLGELVSATVVDWAAFQELKQGSRKWEENLLRGFGIRSRDGIEFTEDASLFHVRKARTNGKTSTIDTLFSANGEMISSRELINREIVDHFTSIFKSRPLPNAVAGQPFLEMVKDRFPSTPSFLTSAITSPDVKNVLLKAKKNKSPGTDGIPYEFYVVFWDMIAPHFTAMFNHALERDSLSPSQGRAAIRLIPKSTGTCGIAGYRPISLLNTDYKLMASVLADRLKKSLVDAIQPHQKGGVPGRLLVDNLCLYRDVIQYADERTSRERQAFPSPTGPKAAIIGVDLAKAYDLVNRDVLWEVMNVMGYPAKFVGWLKTMYSVADMSILNGNELAGSISGVQSIRQGCPLSMHLFVIYIEPLLVRLANSIKGIKLFDKSVSVRAMVDDVVVFVSEDNEIVKAGEILDLFCDWTKAMMNKQKTKILGIGTWSTRTQWPLPWLKSTPTMTLLGIPFSSNITETTERVWNSVHGHMLGIMMENCCRRFNLFQRV